MVFPCSHFWHERKKMHILLFYGQFWIESKNEWKRLRKSQMFPLLAASTQLLQLASMTHSTMFSFFSFLFGLVLRLSFYFLDFHILRLFTFGGPALNSPNWPQSLTQLYVASDRQALSGEKDLELYFHTKQDRDENIARVQNCPAITMLVQLHQSTSIHLLKRGWERQYWESAAMADCGWGRCSFQPLVEVRRDHQLLELSPCTPLPSLRCWTLSCCT